MVEVNITDKIMIMEPRNFYFRWTVEMMTMKRPDDISLMPTGYVDRNVAVLTGEVADKIVVVVPRDLFKKLGRW